MSKTCFFCYSFICSGVLSGIFEKYTLLLSIVYDFERPSGHYDSNSADIIALDFIYVTI